MSEQSKPGLVSEDQNTEDIRFFDEAELPAAGATAR